MKAVVLKPSTSVKPDADIYLADLDPTLRSDATVHFQKGRGTDFLWELDLVVEDHGREGVKYAKLSTGHDKERKEFYAVLRNVVRTGGKSYSSSHPDDITVDEVRAGLYVMESTSLFDSVTVVRQKVERYSAKRMAEFDLHALAALRAAFHDEDGDFTTEEKRSELFPYFGESLYVTKTTARVIDLDPDDTLSGLQAAVEGDIEPIIFPPGYEAYANEDAKSVHAMEPNPVATAIWEKACDDGEYGRLPGDYIAGPVVIVGPLDDDGCTTGLTDDLLAGLHDLLPDEVVWEVPVTA